MVRYTWSIFFVFSFFGCALASRILAVFPHQGWSHFKVFEPLVLELATRGHDVVVISRYPQSKPVANYTDVDLTDGGTPKPHTSVPFEQLRAIPVTLYQDLQIIYRLLVGTEDVFQAISFQNFLASKPQFDVMIVETFNSRLFLALSSVLRVPFIALSSTVLFPHSAAAAATPANPAYIPSMASYYSNRMNFWERLDNVYIHVVTTLGMEFFFNAKAEELKNKYFGEHLPPLREIAKNVSLTLVNSYFDLNGARPLVPGVVEVGGMFLKPAKPLPKHYTAVRS